MCLIYVNTFSLSFSFKTNSPPEKKMDKAVIRWVHQNSSCTSVVIYPVFCWFLQYCSTEQYCKFFFQFELKLQFPMKHPPVTLSFFISKNMVLFQPAYLRVCCLIRQCRYCCQWLKIINALFPPLSCVFDITNSKNNIK